MNQKTDKKIDEEMTQESNSLLETSNEEKTTAINFEMDHVTNRRLEVSARTTVRSKRAEALKRLSHHLEHFKAVGLDAYIEIETDKE